MRTSLVPLLALGLAGCTEYDFNETKDPIGGDTAVDSEDPGPDDSSPPPDRDCPSQVIPGYVTSSDAACENEVATGTFTPVLEWAKGSWSVESNNVDVMSHPIVLQMDDDNGDGVIDGDDVPEVVLVTFDLYTGHTTSGVIRVISGVDGSEIRSITGQGLQGTGGVAGGDIDNDGYPELVSLTPSSAKAFEHDGTLKWTSGSLSGHITGTSDVASIADLDGDGQPEVIAGRAILDGLTGAQVGVGSYGIGGVNGNNVGCASFAADVDADGRQEVVVGNALYKKDGSAKWYNGQSDGYPAVADFDGDGQAEIVVVGNGQLRLQDTDGTVLWSQSIPGASSSYYGGPPTVADYDGDGAPEIGVASGSRYSVFEGSGAILWQAVTDDSSSGNTGSAVFDFEGDGVAEVVYADQTTLWVFNGVDGSVKLASNQHSNGTWLEYPTIADVDGDDHAEILAVNDRQYGSYTGVHCFGDADDSWRPGRRIWNQHAYSITNVNDDGSIPPIPDLNWLSYNNFRSGDMTAGDGTSAPDLTLAQGDLCEIDCEEGRLVLWINPGNEGAADLTVEATIDVYGVEGGTETLIQTIPVAPPLLTGWYADSLEIVIGAAVARRVDAIVFRISSDELECDESNNELRWIGPFCD